MDTQGEVHLSISIGLVAYKRDDSRRVVVDCGIIDGNIVKI